MLESLQNEQVKFVASLQRRKMREETGFYVIEGWRFVGEAVQKRAPLEKVYVSLKRSQPEWESLQRELLDRGIPVTEVDERVLRKMSATEEPQGILAVVRQSRIDWDNLQIKDKDNIGNKDDKDDKDDKDIGSSVLLVVDGVQDPGNLGTILRTALAAGVRSVCLTSGSVDIYNPKVLRSTMGAVFSLDLIRDVSPDQVLDFCREKGLTVLMADTEGRLLYRTDLKRGALALVVGNEGSGPSPVFRNADVQKVTIPMAQEVESLNVAMASGILLYEIARQREFL